MAGVKLTKRNVDALQPRAAEFFAWDSETKGFGVRALPTGRKVFVLKYRPQGQRATRRLTLGTYGALTVDEARRLAKRHLGAIADGADPAAARRDAREAPTVEELGEDYLADVRARRKPSTAREYKYVWTARILPALGSRKVASVTAADVARLHRKMRDVPGAANRMLALVSSFFTYAIREGVRAPGDNPARQVERYPEHEVERYLTAKEFTALGDALVKAEREGLPPVPAHRRHAKSKATAKHRPKSADTPIPANPYCVAAIRLLALTGCRRGEVLSLRWDDVDFERGFLRLGDSKTGKSIRPLGAAAAAILDTLPREVGNPYVLPGVPKREPDGTFTPTHLQTIDRTWFAVRHAAGLDDVRLHDLRHSFASVPAIGGDSLLVIRSLLGHANVKTTERYAHLGDDPVKSAADRTAAAIAAWMDGSETNVTPLRREQK